MSPELPTLSRTAFRYGLFARLAAMLHKERDDLFNPDNPDPWTAEDALTIDRQLRRGELRARRKRELRNKEKIAETRNRPDLPTLLRMGADAAARWLEVHRNDPLPSQELGPDGEWPSWARFRVSIDETLLDEFVDEQVHYATARQVAEIIEPALRQRLEQHPEDAPSINRLRSQLQYWIKHDELCPPGGGNTTEIDGYLWDPDKLGD